MAIRPNRCGSEIVDGEGNSAVAIFAAIISDLFWEKPQK